MGRFIDITGAPIVSDFQEMPLDFMSKALDIQQKQLDNTRTLRESIMPAEGGLATAPIIGAYEKEKYDPLIEDAVKNVVANPREAARKLENIKKLREKDPVLRIAKADLALKPVILGSEKEAGKKGKYMTSYRDPSGKVIPMDINKILSGEITDPSEYYKLGEHVDVVPAVQKMYDESPEIKKIIQTDLGLAATALGAIPFYRQGKQVTNVNRKTVEDMSRAIDRVEDRLLNDKGADWQSWRRENGIEDLDGNMLVTSDIAKQKAEKFALEEAQRIAFNNTSTSTDYQYAQLAGSSGKSGEDSEGRTNSYLDSLGTALSKGKNGILELFKGKSSKDIKKLVTDAALGLMYSKDLQNTNPALFKLGQEVFDKKTGTINLDKLNPYYKEVDGKKILIDPLEQIKIAVNAVPDANSNLFYNNLVAARQGFNLIKGAETESDAIARKRSGYTKADEKQYEAIPEDIRNGLKYVAKDRVEILKDGTVKVKGQLMERGRTEDYSLGKINPKDGGILLKYVEEVNKKDSKVLAYDKIKREEYNKRTNPNYEYQQDWEGVVYSSDAKGAAEKNQMDDAAWSAVQNNITGTGSKESIVTDEDGNPVDLRGKKINRDNMEVIGFAKDTDGTVKMRFSIKESESTGSGSEKSSSSKRLIMTKVPQNVANLYYKYKPTVSSIKDKTTSIIAGWERNPIPQEDAQGNPYVTIKYQYNYPFKMQNINGVNNYTLPEDFIDTYNTMIGPELSTDVDATYDSNTLATIFAKYEAALRLQEYSKRNK